MLDQLRRGTRNHNCRSLRSLLNTGDHNAYTLTNCERLQTRLLFSGSSRLCLAYVEDHVRAFDALHRRVHDFPDATDVLVVNRVTLSLADFLENHLLRKLRCDSSENSFGDLRNLQLSTDFCVGIGLAGIIQRDLKVRVFYLLRCFNNGFHREGADFAAVFVQLRAQIFLGLVILPRSDNDGVFHRANYYLRINPFLSAESIDRVVKLACHMKSIW